MSQYYVNGGGGPAPSTAIETLTGNSGGAVGPDGANNVNTVGSGSVTVVGNPGTNTLTAQLTGLTNHNLLIGAGTDTITKVAPSATSGVPVISQGAAADPAYGTAVVAGGGTGNTTFTAYGVVCAGTTATGAFQNVSGLGTSGQVLTSNGAGALPTWQAGGGGSGITTINGTTGSATGSTVTFTATRFNVGGNNSFVASGSTVALVLSSGASGNLYIGSNAGSTASAGGMNNTLFGNFSGASLTTSSTSNCGVGNSVLGSLQGGTWNQAFGGACLGTLVSGSNNVGLGSCSAFSTGNNYNGAESNNILIQNAGVNGESNVTRIGTEGTGIGQQSTCYIAGIANATVTGSAVLVDVATGQLGLVVSSRRFKKDIRPLDAARVTDLEPVSFLYKNDTEQRPQFGLIAEQVAEVIPELVEYRDNEPYTVHYHMLAPLLLAEIKALKERICKLENKHGL